MEIVFKILVTAVSLIVIWLIAVFTIRTWKSQVDVVETLKNIFSISYESALVIRDENSIYQNGEVVGKIRGRVEESSKIITMYDVINAEKLNFNDEFEYKKFKLQLVERGSLCVTCNENGVFLGKTFEWLKCGVLVK